MQPGPQQRGSPSPGTHLQRLALGPLLAHLQPHVLQVPPATQRLSRGPDSTGSSQKLLGTPPARPQPHSQVLDSHQVHEDVQGPDLSLQVLQGQRLSRPRCRQHLHAPRRAGRLPRAGERGTEPPGLLPPAGTPSAPQGQAGRPLARHAGARGGGVAQLGCGDRHHAEAVSICQSESISARCRHRARPRHGCSAQCWHPTPTCVSGSAQLHVSRGTGLGAAEPGEGGRGGQAGPCSALPWGRRQPHSGDQAWASARPRCWGHRRGPRHPHTAVCLTCWAAWGPVWPWQGRGEQEPSSCWGGPWPPPSSPVPAALGAEAGAGLGWRRRHSRARAGQEALPDGSCGCSTGNLPRAQGSCPIPIPPSCPSPGLTRALPLLVLRCVTGCWGGKGAHQALGEGPPSRPLSQGPFSWVGWLTTPPPCSDKVSRGRPWLLPGTPGSGSCGGDRGCTGLVGDEVPRCSWAKIPTSTISNSCRGQQ